jgi:hypothetical protein
MNLKDLYLNGDKEVVRFKSISNFLNYCYARKLTKENSETFYDSQDERMYLKPCKEDLHTDK